MRIYDVKDNFKYARDDGNLVILYHISPKIMS